MVENNNTALTAAMRYIVENTGTFVAVALNVSKRVAGDVDNAVLPAWRNTLLDVILST